MAENKTPESVLKAQKKYRAKVLQDDEKRLRSNYLASRRATNSFIKNKATEEDLEMIINLVEERKKALDKAI
jgi:hypothetical protein